MLLIYPVKFLVILSPSTRKTFWEIIIMVNINNICNCFSNLCIWPLSALLNIFSHSSLVKGTLAWRGQLTVKTTVHAGKTGTATTQASQTVYLAVSKLVISMIIISL